MSGARGTDNKGTDGDEAKLDATLVRCGAIPDKVARMVGKHRHVDVLDMLPDVSIKDSQSYRMQLRPVAGNLGDPDVGLEDFSLSFGQMDGTDSS